MNSAWHIHKEIKKNLKIDAEMNEDKVMYNFCRLVDRMDAVSYFMDKIYVSTFRVSPVITIKLSLCILLI